MARGLFIWLIAAFLLVAGCGVPSIPVHVSTSMEQDEVALLLADVEVILGMPINVRTRTYGSIVLDIHRTHPDEVYGGKSLVRVLCHRGVWAEPNPEIIAHELAHALGLGHVEDENNLMHVVATGVELTEHQIRELWAGARWLNACDPRS